MPKRKSKSLTLAEHVELGQRLHQHRIEAMAIARQLGETYPMTSKPSLLAEKLWTPIDVLRCEMDNRVFQEHPVEAEPKIYF